MTDIVLLLVVMAAVIWPCVRAAKWLAARAYDRRVERVANEVVDFEEELDRVRRERRP